MTSPTTILLLGGTGKVGRNIAKLLATTTISTFQASRRGDVTTEPEAANIKPVRFDWTDKDSWDTVLSCSPDAIFLVAPPVTEMLEPMSTFIDKAKVRGTKRFVLLSSSALECDINGIIMGQVHAYLKQMGDRGKLEWAVLRPSWFQENFMDPNSHTHGKTIREESTVYSATGNGKVPWVSAADIGACGFQLLTQKAAPNRDYLILGPELLSYGDIADVLSDVLGRKITHTDMTARALEQRFMKTFGMPQEYAEMLSAMDVAIKNGSENRTNDVVLALTGKQPSSFRAFAERNKEAWATEER